MSSMHKKASYLWLSFLSGILFIAALALRLDLINCYNPEIGAVDMNVVYGIQRILAGEPLYQNPLQPPYAVIQYMPLHYYIVAGIAKVTGIGFTAVQDIYALSRTLALLFNLLTVLLLIFIFRSLRTGWRTAVTWAMFLLILLPQHYYLRCDSLELLCFTAALLGAFRYAERPSPRWLLFTAVFTALCILSKQNGILIAGIIGCYLLIAEKNIRQAIYYTLQTAAFTLLLLLLFTQGDLQSFYENAWLGLKNGIDIFFFKKPYFFLIPFFLTALPAIYFFLKKGTPKYQQLIATGLILSFAFASVTAIKIGSDINYYTEFILFLLLAFPLLLKRDPGDARLLPKTGIRVSHLAIGALLFVLSYKTIHTLITHIDRPERTIQVASNTMGISFRLHIEPRNKSNPEAYFRQMRLLEYFKRELHLHKGEYVFMNFLYVGERTYLDNIFFESSIQPTIDVSHQLYHADPTDYLEKYASFIEGMNNGLIKYIVAPAEKEDIFIRRNDIPYIRFDAERFDRIAEVEGFAIYQYRPSGSAKGSGEAGPAQKLGYNALSVR